VSDLFDWIEAIHQAVMETDNLEDFDGLSLWWRDTIANGLSDESRNY
jgi:hypothetical protein